MKFLVGQKVVVGNAWIGRIVQNAHDYTDGFWVTPLEPNDSKGKYLGQDCFYAEHNVRALTPEDGMA